jgi:hypothetical protein
MCLREITGSEDGKVAFSSTGNRSAESTVSQLPSPHAPIEGKYTEAHRAAKYAEHNALNYSAEALKKKADFCYDEAVRAETVADNLKKLLAL